MRGKNIIDEIAKKKNTLSASSNIITGTISCDSITGSSTSTIQAPTIKATSNLFVNDTDIIVELGKKTEYFCRRSKYIH